MHKLRLLAAERRVLADVRYGVDVRSAFYLSLVPQLKFKMPSIRYSQAQELLLYRRAPPGMSKGYPQNSTSKGRPTNIQSSPSVNTFRSLALCDVRRAGWDHSTGRGRRREWRYFARYVCTSRRFPRRHLWPLIVSPDCADLLAAAVVLVALRLTLGKNLNEMPVLHTALAH